MKNNKNFKFFKNVSELDSENNWTVQSKNSF